MSATARFVRRIVIVLITAAGVLAPAAVFSAPGDDPAPGTVQLNLLEAPTERRDDPRASIYIIDHLKPGSSISRRIGVTNRSNDALRISLYVGGASVSDGGFQPLDGRAPSELASWGSVEPSSVDVPAFDQSIATVKFTVPDDASEGERYGAVWAELPVAKPKKGGVAQLNRVGIRVYLSVGPGGEPASDFEIDSLTAGRERDRTPIVRAKVRNTGGRALDMSGSLVLSDGPGGLRAGPFPARLGTTLGVGESANVEVPMDKQVPNGPWHAKLTMRSGLTERAVTGRITFPDDGGQAEPVDVAPVRRFPVLIAALIGGALVLLLLLVAVRRRRRRETES